MLCLTGQLHVQHKTSVMWHLNPHTHKSLIFPNYPIKGLTRLCTWSLRGKFLSLCSKCSLNTFFYSQATPHTPTLHNRRQAPARDSREGSQLPISMNTDRWRTWRRGWRYGALTSFCQPWKWRKVPQHAKSKTSERVVEQWLLGRKGWGVTGGWETRGEGRGLSQHGLAETLGLCATFHI